MDEAPVRFDIASKVRIRFYYSIARRFFKHIRRRERHAIVARSSPAGKFQLPEPIFNFAVIF